MNLQEIESQSTQLKEELEKFKECTNTPQKVFERIFSEVVLNTLHKDYILEEAEFNGENLVLRLPNANKELSEDIFKLALFISEKYSEIYISGSSDIKGGTVVLRRAATELA